ncbi:unnamed protein product [Rhizoctonia solani]|uniref:IucC family-domain-containing protein n=1 Tax=Rhizoctonia solani TaxID=456999 RepID=A0A8H2W7H4_9AGAM|nr:unnamed protein product [Rhizoctonia solani]
MASKETGSGRIKLAQEAAMETTSRLLAALVNEGLVFVTADDSSDVSSLFLSTLTENSPRPTRIVVELRQGTKYRLEMPVTQKEFEEQATIPIVRVVPELDPADILAPIIIEHSDELKQRSYRPEEVFDVVGPWICNDEEVLVKLRDELQNSADNQEKWLEFALSCPLPVLGASLIEWEQRCFRGHPTHPMHRSFFASPPSEPIQIDVIEKLLEAEVIIISVPRTRIHLDGPFEASMKPLLDKIGIVPAPADRVLLPCFAEQLPAVHAYFGTDAEKVLSKTKLHGQRQVSMRTVSIPDFQLHVKMALSYTITSATRTMTPWTARMCIEVSQLLQDITSGSDLLWIARKMATACSADPDFEKAKHLSVMLREDLEPKARELGQCLVLPATLFEIGGEDRVAYVLRVFDLFTIDARKNWFLNHTRTYLQTVLPPLLSHGICLEAHMQNMLVRFEVKSGALRGFIYRDMGGLRMHVSTMALRGVTTKSASLVPGGVILTDDLEAVWVNAYHNFVVNHLGGALRAMGLSWVGGWDIVRKELTDALTLSADPKSGELLEFMLQPKMKRKAASAC